MGYVVLLKGWTVMQVVRVVQRQVVELMKTFSFHISVLGTR
jgi:hypothetical protein